MAIKYNVM